MCTGPPYLLALYRPALAQPLPPICQPPPSGCAPPRGPGAAFLSLYRARTLPSQIGAAPHATHPRHISLRTAPSDAAAHLQPTVQWLGRRCRAASHSACCLDFLIFDPGGALEPSSSFRASPHFLQPRPAYMSGRAPLRAAAPAIGSSRPRLGKAVHPMPVGRVPPAACRVSMRALGTARQGPRASPAWQTERSVSLGIPGWTTVAGRRCRAAISPLFFGF